MRNVKVLMADDEPDILRVMARKVREAGYEVVTARDGQEAWELIDEHQPDIILLDLIMPRMDGYAFLEKLHKEKTKCPPVIIISAQGELKDIRKGFSLEADHYITKPCQMEDVLKGIRLMVKLIPQRKDSED